MKKSETTLTYNGYIGSIETSPEDNCLYGSIQGLKSTTLIYYEGTTIKEFNERHRFNNKKTA